MNETPWFWDTPEGGGWVCYLRGGTLVDRYSLAHMIEMERDADRRTALQQVLDMRPNRDPTQAERRAYRKINPPAEGQGEDPD